MRTSPSRWWPAALAGALALALALPSLGQARTPASERAPEPAIVFASTRDGNTDLYLAAADGTGARRLTEDPAPDRFPRCSPDGRHVVFVRGDGAEAELHRLDLDTGSVTRLTTDGVRDATPSWSADGTRIYFTRRDGAHDRIAAIGACGGEATFLTDGAAHDTMPSASPDGRALVHHTYRYPGGTELQRIDLATLAGERLTERDGNAYEAAFAGPGQVVFSSNQGAGYYRLHVLDLATGGVRLLADTGQDAWGARPSPATGEVLFYTGSQQAGWRLMRVPLAGGEPRPVLADPHSSFAADWCLPVAAPAGDPGAAAGAAATARLPALADLSWLVGRWRGEGFGGTVDEVWLPADAGAMVGMFRLVAGSEVQVYEIFTIAQDLRLRLKHFHADLTGWEERDDRVELPFVSAGPQEVVFDGLRYALLPDGRLRAVVTVGREPCTGDVELLLRRVGE